MAPKAEQVPTLVKSLFKWLKESGAHPLVKSCVFHYEFEFIHPFADGNGRTGRYWQTAILGKWRDAFYAAPIENIVWENQSGFLVWELRFHMPGGNCAHELQLLKSERSRANGLQQEKHAHRP